LIGSGFQVLLKALRRDVLPDLRAKLGICGPGRLNFEWLVKNEILVLPRTFTGEESTVSKVRLKKVLCPICRMSKLAIFVTSFAKSDVLAGSFAHPSPWDPNIRTPIFVFSKSSASDVTFSIVKKSQLSEHFAEYLFREW
jgi:hypothetical protein